MPRKPMNGVRLHVIVTSPQHQALAHITNRTGLPMSEVLRRAIDRYLHSEDVRSGAAEARKSGS